jgi:hypothetical protein
VQIVDQDPKDWVVEVDLLPTTPADLEATASDLLDLLIDRDAATAAGDGRISVTLTGYSADALDALMDGIHAAREAIVKIAGMEWPVAAARVVDYDQLEREQEAERLELAGAAEVAQELGVSRTRVRALLTTLEQFPRPLATLAAGPVWDLAAVQAFAARWERRSGRPRTRATA